MTEFFATLDKAYGISDDRLISSQVKVDWCRWAHERTINAGYNANDSHKWLLKRKLDWKIVAKETSSPVLRQQFNLPDGLFPQNWPKPDEDPSKARRKSHIIAALIMDDHDNQTSTDQ
eukprot:3819227-Amphidinium_carterae.1